jgi:isopenicillin N synthase-like dioxygenase
VHGTARSVWSAKTREGEIAVVLESLPVLDFSRLDPGEEAAAAFRNELRAVTHEVGFFFLIGHRVDPKLTADLLAASRAFFELPAEQKLAIENVHSPQFRGYTREGS